MNKRKIINDPVYGFIKIRSELLYDVISHPWFQRLRRIRQLGLTDFVYPGAIHTRFQHALGAMHLMGLVLDNLRTKGTEISDQEFEASQLAILLHDIGHGPFSHALEETLLTEVRHESLSYLFIQELNKQFYSALELSMKIFRNSYSRKFFHQLVSSQLDIDRLDYLKRDCFFTGVQEGTIGVDRIISMLQVHNDQLVVEEKGIYSIENFLNARRLMYWQVYLHKTAVSAERMLINLIRRAQYLVQSGSKVSGSTSLLTFLNQPSGIKDFQSREILNHYGNIDDYDIWGAIKLWQESKDLILSTLAGMLLDRELFQIRLAHDPVQKKSIEKIKAGIVKTYSILRSETPYLFSCGVVSNEAYAEGEKINVLTRKGEVVDIAQASDLPAIKAISKIVEKNYLCWPKNVSL